MRILALHTWTSGVAEARIWMYSRALIRQGHTVTHFPGVDDNAYQHLHDITTGGLEQWLTDNVRDYDAIVSQYTYSVDVVKLLLASREYADIPLIVDVDDDFLNVPTYNLAFKTYHGGAQGRAIIKMLCKSAECVLVSTAPLQNTIKHLCRHTVLAPNCVDPMMWGGLDVDPARGDDASVRFLFSGGQGRVDDLGVVKEPFEWLMAKYPQVRLLFLACAPPWAEPYMSNKVDPSANRAFLIQPCYISTYRASVKWVAPDVWFNPLVPNKFNESKSSLKFLDAAMVLAAYIGSDGPTHSVLPDDVMLKCSTPYQWRESLEQLVLSPQLRHRLATAATAHALKEWQIDQHCHKWVEAIEWAMANRVRQASDVIGLT